MLLACCLTGFVLPPAWLLIPPPCERDASEPLSVRELKMETQRSATTHLHSGMKRELVKIRFDLNLAERAQDGKAAPEPTMILDVDLSQLEQRDRGLLTRRLELGKDNVFDVCRLQWDGTKEFRRPTRQEGLADFYASQFPVRVQAHEATLEALLQAVREDFNRFKIR